MASEDSTKMTAPATGEQFLGRKHLDELDDDLRLSSNEGRRQGQGKPCLSRGGRKSTSSSNGGQDRIDEEEEEDQEQVGKNIL